MKTEIFITPSVDLSWPQIDKCIAAGAASARIHCGKASLAKIVELVRGYHQRGFRFNLDLRGNKANVQTVDRAGSPSLDLKLDDRVTFFAGKFLGSEAEGTNYVELNFIPEALNTVCKGNLTVDDGRLIFDIVRINKRGGLVSSVETMVSRAEQKILYKSDGVSSTSIPIHSGSIDAFTAIDRALLHSIPNYIRYMVKYIAISFCESAQHIINFDEFLKRNGYSVCQVVPKVETLAGVTNIDQICQQLSQMYGENALLHIGCADLSLDVQRKDGDLNYYEFVDRVIGAGHKYGVRVSVLAMLLQSVRHKMKQNPDILKVEPTEEELANIGRLLDQEVFELGLTNDMYVERPERVVELLRSIIDSHSQRLSQAT